MVSFWKSLVARLANARQIVGVGAAVAVTPLLVLFLGRELRRWLGPGDSRVLLWWPEDAWHAAWVIKLGAVCGLIIFVHALLKGVRIRPVVILSVVIGTAAAVSSILSWTASTRLYPDRIEARPGLFMESRSAQSLPLEHIPYVDAYCYRMRERKWRVWKPKARLAYVLAAPNHAYGVDLMQGAIPRGGRKLTRFQIVQMLDETVLKNVWRTTRSKGEPACFRRLREQTSAQEFSVMLALMRIDDQTFLRDYAEPHEQWNRRQDANLR